ncbi:MAG: membrane protein insertion efficiency factor YidD [Rhodospirillales bacterium]|nr:membrane protein insertion efficiency factor YidD [Rhodospirillales bacterium]
MHAGATRIRGISPGAWVGIGAVRVYQWTLRPVLGGNCRFAPSCSDYAVEALRRHGAVRGSGLAAWRILRCNPWCQGGYDPVPEHGRFVADSPDPAAENRSPRTPARENSVGPSAPAPGIDHTGH